MSYYEKSVNRTYFLIFLVWVVLITHFYVGGAFIEATLDMTKWEDNVRDILGGLWIGVTLVTWLFFIVSRHTKSS